MTPRTDQQHRALKVIDDHGRELNAPRAVEPNGQNASRTVEENGLSAPRGVEENGGKLLQVGDLAKAAGKTVRAIHLYEELGLLRPSARSKGRYRLYGPDALVRARWINKLQELGMSLNDIRVVVQEWENSPTAPGAMTRMRETYRNKLQETRDQIVRLVALEHELAASLEYLETCDSCDPARLLSACSSCDMHHQCSSAAPELVAGLSAQVYQG